MTIKFRLLLIVFIAIISVSCGKKKKEILESENQVQKSINPNGDSELALLMRDMYDEAENIKKQIANGEVVTVSLDHQKILTAHATEPEKAASEEYKAFANMYLNSLKSLEEANETQLASRYDNLVANCMACHKTLCPGPVVKIKKLK